MAGDLGTDGGLARLGRGGRHWLRSLERFERRTIHGAHRSRHGDWARWEIFSTPVCSIESFRYLIRYWGG